MKLNVWVAGLSLLALRVGAVTVGGRVFVDADGNGQWAAGEAGVAGVAVSDGARVTLTDESGAYRLESAEAAPLVWVCLPRGHAASGAFWKQAQEGLAADFGLVPQPQAGDFTFVQITDAHIGRGDLLKRFAQHLPTLPVPFAFVVNTGDLVGGVDVVPPEKAQIQYDRYSEAAAAFAVPLFNLPGNHEHVGFNCPGSDTNHPFYGKGLYRKVFGPTYYAWEWAGVHFVALDGTSLPYQERLGSRQLAWLAADLAVVPAERPVVLFCHQSIPQLRDAQELADVLKGRRVLGAFCGHLHQTFTTRLGEIPVYLSGAMSGAWWSGPNIDGTPQGFRLVRIRDGALSTAYFGREGATPMSAVSPLATSVLSGEVEVEAVVADFGQPVALEAAFAGQPAAFAQVGREELWSVWRGKVDTRPAFDGDRVLKLTARRGGETGAFEIRYLVENGRAEPYQAAASATLSMQVRNVDASNPVLFNGEPLGVIPAGTTNGATVAFEVDRGRLGRLNRVTVQAGPQGKGKDLFSVGPVWLGYRGRRIHDLRYASFERFFIVGDDPRRSEKTLYYCLPPAEAP